MATEVGVRSANNVSLGENMNSDGTIQNPTIQAEAQKTCLKMGRKSARSICCTVWTESEEFRHSEFERISKIWKLTTKCMIFGAIEKTEENKRPHLHCVMFWEKPKKFTTILKILPSKFYHIEAAKTQNEAIEYAWKHNPDDILQFGELPKQGERTDIKKQLETFKSYEDFMISEPKTAIRYKNGIKDYYEFIHKNERKLKYINAKLGENGKLERAEFIPAIVHYWFGETGAGKSKYMDWNVIDDINEKYELAKLSIICSFDNGFAIGEIEEDTEILIIDEFRADIPFKKILNLINGTYIGVKNGRVFMKPKEIYITSSLEPWALYKNLPKNDNINQLLRRITDCQKFTSKGSKIINLNEIMEELDTVDW